MNPWQSLIEPPKSRPGDAIRITEPKRRQRVRRPANGRPPKMDLPQIENPWKLTACHCAVLRGLIDGLTNGQIATRLGVSEKMVEQHLREARYRMGGAARVTAAVQWDRFIRGMGQ